MAGTALYPSQWDWYHRGDHHASPLSHHPISNWPKNQMNRSLRTIMIIGVTQPESLNHKVTELQVRAALGAGTSDSESARQTDLAARGSLR